MQLHIRKSKQLKSGKTFNFEIGWFKGNIPYLLELRILTRDDDYPEDGSFFTIFSLQIWKFIICFSIDSL